MSNLKNRGHSSEKGTMSDGLKKANMNKFMFAGSKKKRKKLRKR